MNSNPANPTFEFSLPSWRPILLIIASTAFLLLPSLVRASLLDEARQALQAGQHAKALELAEKQIKNEPMNAQARFLKGMILIGMNRPNDALEVFKKLTEDFPALPEPYNNLAVIYAQQKQYDKARAALEQAIRTHPSYATAYENLGDIYSFLASQAYGRVLSIDASNATAQTKLAIINDLIGSSKTPPASAAKSSAALNFAAKPVETPKPATTSPVSPTPSDKKTALPPPSPAQPQEPARAGSPPASLEAEIAATIDAWLAAWTNKDVKAYLSFYAPDFEPPRGLQRAEWENERRQRVGKPGKIKVEYERLSVKAEGKDKAVAQFRQKYRSDNFNATGTKTLVLVKRENKWLILKESSK